ncbi:MAG: hypothetical protein AB1720_11595 [Pseudomonadota bacterium]
MADPRQELADIVAPTAPELAVAAGGGAPVWALAVLIAGVGAVLVVWLWRRRQPQRRLRAIAAAATAGQGAPGELAARLDAWARAAYRLPRVDATQPPAGIDAADWADWAQALERLRFAAQPSDGHAVAAQLCARAGAWGRHA